MSASVIAPFNFQPVNVAVGNGSYTVPSGKYAMVSYSISAKLVFSSASIPYTSRTVYAIYPGQSESSTIEGTFWLKAGDVLTFSSTSEPNDIFHLNTYDTTSFIYPAFTPVAFARVLVNGVAVNNTETKTFPATTYNYTGSSADDVVIVYSVSYTAGFLASEYNNIF
jgi:hypothetical protein